MTSTQGNASDGSPAEVPNSHDGKEETLLRRHCGLLYGVSAAFFYALLSACMSVSMETMEPPLLIALMSPVMSICCLVILIYYNDVPLPEGRERYAWLSVTGLGTSVYALLLSSALSEADYGDVVTITFVSVILVAFLGWAVLGESFRLVDLAMAVVTFLGVGFVSRPTFIFRDDREESDENRLRAEGIGFALATAVVISFLMVSMRNQAAVLGVNPVHTIFANGAMFSVAGVSACTVLGCWRALTIGEWVASIGAGICYLSAHLLCLCALKHGRALVVNILLTLEIVFAFLLQIVVFGNPPPWTSYVGSSLIISASIGINVKRDLGETDDDNPSEQRGSEDQLLMPTQGRSSVKTVHK